MACVDTELCNKIDTIAEIVQGISMDMSPLIDAIWVVNQIYILLQVLLLAMVIVFLYRWFWRNFN